MLRVWSANVGLGSGIWKVVDDALEASVDIILIQECGMDQEKFSSFRDSMWARGLRAYFAGGYRREDGRAGGGLVTLVTRSRPSRQLWQREGAKAQALAVSVGTVLAVNVYCQNTKRRKDHQSGPLLDEVGNAMQVDRVQRAIVAGDWNLPHDEASMPSEWHTLHYPRQEDGAPMPTRWDGKRTIDYAIGYGIDGTTCTARDLAASDHRVISYGVPTTTAIVEEKRLHQHADVARPSHTSMETWMRITSELWGPHERRFQQNPCPHEPDSDEAQAWVDARWKDMETTMERVMKQAAAMTNEMDDELRPGREEEEEDEEAATPPAAEGQARPGRARTVTDGPRWRAADFTGSGVAEEWEGPRRATTATRRRGEVPKGKTGITNKTTPARSAHTERSHRARRCANELGRLRRLLWLEEHGAGRGKEAQTLRGHLARTCEGFGSPSPARPDSPHNSDNDVGNSGSQLERIHHVRAQTARCEQNLRDIDNEDRKDRTRAWRERLRRDPKAQYSYIRGRIPKGIAVHTADTDGSSGTTSTTTMEALTLLVQRWRKVWDRATPPREDWERELTAWLPDCTETAWDPLNRFDVLAALRAQAGTAAGPDGWSGGEVASAEFTLDAMVDFYNTCEALARLPAQWTALKQSHLPKEEPPPDTPGALRDDKFRPISVASSWYRAWASARCRSASFRRWQKQWWDDDAAGGVKGKEAADATMALISGAGTGEYLASWDFSLAFDMCHPRVATFALDRVGLPGNLRTMLGRQWGNQQRWMTYGGCCHPEPQQVDSSLPQGDPWSPVAM